MAARGAVARREIAASVLIPADERWNPLEHVTAPEYVPPTWDGVHVGVRLVEAFKTLSKMPTPGLSTKSGIWPEYRHEWADLLARADGDPEIALADALGRNRARLLPSRVDVGRMEIALIWPARYLGGRPLICRLVQRVAMLRAREYDLDRIARKLRAGSAQVRRRNRDGLDAIAAGLRRDGVPVF